MRNKLVAEMKRKIEEKLKGFLQDEGLELFVASNDNMAAANPLVELESIDDIVLSGSKLLFEIQVVLRLLGKPWQCDSLIRGIYYTLHPHNLTVSELTVLLMSMHVEDMASKNNKMQESRVVMRYVVESVVCELPDAPRLRHYNVEEC